MSERPGPRWAGPLGRLVGLYATQLRVMWTWRAGPLALAVRVVVSLLVSAAGLLLADWALAGLRIAEPLAPLVAAIVLGLLNLLVRPLLLAIAAPVSGILIAILAMVLQVVLVMALAPLVPGVQIDGVLTAFWASWIIALTNTILTAVFAFDRGDTYFGALVHQLIGTSSAVERSDRPGVVIVQIDGAAHPVLRHQVRAGQVPVMAAWLRTGTHRLMRWHTLLPSQTSAAQAGLLHGNNDEIPAFRWYDKRAGRLVVSSRPEDAAEIERRVSDGRGLLSDDGASIGNLLSGDAARAYLTLARLSDRTTGIGRSQAYYGFFLSPYRYLHTVLRFVGEVVKERYQALRQRRRGIEPRLARGGIYPFMRAATNVLLRDLGTAFVIEEMYRGAPVIFIDYTDYDEIAHHSGPERPEALAALDGVDEAIGAIQRAALDAPRPYRIAVLSDHGQSLGATFLQRYGETLEEVVRSLTGGAEDVIEATSRVEEWGPINAFLTELTRGRGATSTVARLATRGRTRAGLVRVGPPAAKRRETTDAAESAGGDVRPDLVVVASGNLGLISLPKLPGRATLEQLAELHPGMVDALANHPGIGLVLVRTAEHGSIAVARDGIRFLDQDRVEGQDPAAQYGRHAVEALRRLDGMDAAPDVAVISMVDPNTDEVAAFEELIGSHGGLGGAQTAGLLVVPAEWASPDDEPIGAPAVHRLLRGWLAGMGIGPDATADGAPRSRR